MKSNNKILIFCILGIVLINIIYGFIFLIKIITNYVEQNMCYNMPLNDFYKNSNCLKFTEEYYE